MAQRSQALTCVYLKSQNGVFTATEYKAGDCICFSSEDQIVTWSRDGKKGYFRFSSTKTLPQMRLESSDDFFVQFISGLVGTFGFDVELKKFMNPDTVLMLKKTNTGGKNEHPKYK